MEAILVVLIVCGVLFGFVGLALASHKGASGTAGFFLGAFLGPIGLIIAALLGPSPDSPQTETVSVPRKFDGNPDLGNDAYKLWLASRYEIKKNDVLSSYVCDDRLFPTVDGALEYAHGKHEDELAAAKAEEELRQKQRAVWEEAERKRQAVAREQFERWKPYLIGGGAFAFILLCGFVYLAIGWEQQERARQRQEAAAEKQKQDAARASVNKDLAAYGVAVSADGYDASEDRDSTACAFSVDDVITESHNLMGKSARFSARSEVDGAFAAAKLVQPAKWDDITTTLSSTSLDAGNKEQLFRSKDSRTYVLISATQKRDSFDPKGPETKVHLCVGRPDPQPNAAAADQTASPAEGEIDNASGDSLPADSSPYESDEADGYPSQQEPEQASDLNETVS